MRWSDCIRRHSPDPNRHAIPPPTRTNLQAKYEQIEERQGGQVVRRYLKGKLLGKGGFAKCYLATCLQVRVRPGPPVVRRFVVRCRICSDLTIPPPPPLQPSPS